MHGGGRKPVRAILEKTLGTRLRRRNAWNATSVKRRRQARDAPWSCGNQPAYHSMINRRSVAALHRACLHRQHQPETENSGRECSRKPIEYGHDSVLPVFIGDSRDHPGSLRRLQIVDTVFGPEIRRTPGVHSRRSTVNRTAVYIYGFSKPSRHASGSLITIFPSICPRQTLKWMNEYANPHF